MTEPLEPDLLSVDEAIAIVDAVAVSPRVVELSLASARGCVLAESVVADRDYPPFDKALMDGFATRAGEQGERVIVGEVQAGRSFDRADVPAHSAVAIMTGAPMPSWADAVVPIEWTSVQGDRLTITKSVSVGKAIARRGSDARAGDALLDVGTILGPQQIAVLAQVGKTRVRVIDRPGVSIVVTGDEIIPADQSPAGSQIRDCNSHLLQALLTQLGCDVVLMTRAVDEPDATRNVIAHAAASADVTFITGGMSMGAYDFVPGALADLGFVAHVKKLKIKPGKPLVFASHASTGKFAFGLPGNPVSGFVCTIRLAARLLARLSGKPVVNPIVPATLTADLPANGPREFYQPAILVARDTGLDATPLQWNGSADVFTLARCNGLIVRSENEPARPLGERVGVMRLGVDEGTPTFRGS
jgi:molybdenum cofactor synthesis domain-containing protein